MSNIKKLGLEEVSNIYDNFIIPYFPDNEVKPLKNIISMMESGLYSVYVMEKDERAVAAAFLTTYPDGNAYLLDYLATSKDVRSLGYGSRLLSEIKNYTEGLPILIETESLESSRTEEERIQRKKRNAFYERAGAVKTEVITRIFYVEYCNWILLPDKNKVSSINVINELTGIYKFMVNKERIYNDNVFIPWVRD